MDNKNLILEKALILFASKGYDGAGVQEICDSSGITKPTLYYYFGSKKGLLDELLSSYFSIMNLEIKTACNYKGDLVLTLETIAGCYFSLAKRFPLFYRTHLALTYGPPESEATQAVVSHMKEQYLMIEEVFKSAVVQHGNMRSREKIYAATFIGNINTYISLNFHGNFALDGADIFRLVHQFMHGILS